MLEFRIVYLNWHLSLNTLKQTIEIFSRTTVLQNMLLHCVICTLPKPYRPSNKFVLRGAAEATMKS